MHGYIIFRLVILVRSTNTSTRTHSYRNRQRACVRCTRVIETDTKDARETDASVFSPILHFGYNTHIRKTYTHTHTQAYAHTDATTHVHCTHKRTQRAALLPETH